MLYMFLLFSPLFLYGFYVVFVLAYGTFTEFQPEEKIILQKENAVKAQLKDSTISFVSWNIGYGGLGYKADFFLDEGEMVRSTKNDVKKYLTGVHQFIKAEKDADFILLQEVDRNSKRSYETDEYADISEILSEHEAVFAENFKVKYIPVPLTSTDPLGKVRSGLASFSKYETIENKRLQFPGEYEWPKRIFHLDRCMLVSRLALENGKDLVVINSHNSAYDGGVLKPQEMAYLKEYLLAEYAKGNYVVVGADWNQCPPNFAYDTFAPNNAEDYFQDNIKEDFLPEGWKWTFDPNTATNRKLSAPYNKETTFTTLIDFYLVSPNLEVVKVETVDLDFQFSDHQPVKLEVRLK